MLKRLLRPFIKQVHPDFHHNASAAVKRTNEQSLQQLNTILDTLEQLGQGPQHAQRTQQPRSLQPTSLEASYELTFHLVPSAGKKKGAGESTVDVDTPSASAAAAAAAAAPSTPLRPPPSFTARLTFPSTTLSRFAREAPFTSPPFSSSSSSSDSITPSSPSTPSPGFALPEEIAQQLRKLFQGARLQVPKELETSDGGSHHNNNNNRGRRARSRREGMIGGKEVENMVLADLMARDLKVEGPSEAQRRVAVARLLRSGRVLTKGMSVAEEAVALGELEEVLVGVWERGMLGEKEVGGRLQIVLDAESEMLHWDVLPEGRGHLIICPMDVKGARFRLASILRTIGAGVSGGRAGVGREEGRAGVEREGGQEEEEQGGRRVAAAARTRAPPGGGGRRGASDAFAGGL